jgi:hypothetical protein
VSSHGYTPAQNIDPANDDPMTTPPVQASHNRQGKVFPQRNTEKKWRKLHFFMWQTSREKQVKISNIHLIFSAICPRENISSL